MTLLALAGTLLPPATCMGLGQACCCGGGQGGTAAPGDLLSSGGCGCQGPQVASCAPDAKPAAPATERLTPRLALASLGILAGVPPLGVPAPAFDIASTSDPPAPVIPGFTLFCCLRI
jgi:hypothetical protein